VFFKHRDSGEAMRDQAARKLYDCTHYKLDRKARAGDVRAALIMARYWLGEGPRKDPQNALWYLPEPARAGNTEARMLMVLALLDGINDVGGSFCGWASTLGLRFLYAGAEPDQWMIDEANEGGNGLRVLVSLLKIHHGDASAEMAAFGKLLEYALDGSPPAAAAVGWCFWLGKGTPGDYERAYVWFSVAKTLGMKSVDDDMRRLAQKLPPDRLLAVQKDAANTFDVIIERPAKQQAAEAERAPAS
jgi:TPR repeat protein